MPLHVTKYDQICQNNYNYEIPKMYKHKEIYLLEEHHALFSISSHTLAN